MSATRQRITREGCTTKSSASSRRTTTSLHICDRQASTMPRPRSSADRACSEYSSSMISPGHELAFAGAAIAGLATVGKADAVGQQRVEHGVALLCGSGLVQIGDGYGEGHGRMAGGVPADALRSTSKYGNQTVGSQTIGGRPASRGSGASAQSAGLGVLPGLIGYQLRLAQRAIFADFVDSVGDAGISPGLFGILVVIDANRRTDPAGPGQRRAPRSLHHGDRDRQARRPRAGGAARRGPPQQRTVPYRRQAPRCCAACRRKVARHERRVVQNLSEREREQLVSLLQRILPERR